MQPTQVNVLALVIGKLSIYLAHGTMAAALPLVLISYYSKMSPLSQNTLAVTDHAVRHLHWLLGLS